MLLHTSDNRKGPFKDFSWKNNNNNNNNNKKQVAGFLIGFILLKENNFLYVSI